MTTIAINNNPTNIICSKNTTNRAYRPVGPGPRPTWPEGPGASPAPAALQLVVVAILVTILLVTIMITFIVLKLLLIIIQPLTIKLLIIRLIIQLPIELRPASSS